MTTTPDRPIDLRSDTVTRPTPGMRTVTHLDVTRQECERAARVLARLANGGGE
jgi:hypothetical protein